MKDRLARERIKWQRRLNEERDRRYSERFSAQEHANGIALSAANERLERMNQFRDQLTSQAASFVTRDTLDAELKSIHAITTRLENVSAATQGRGAGVTSLISYGIAVAGVLIAIAAIVFK